MKTYLVTLRDNKDAIVEANCFHRDNEQYVFEGKDPTEVQFFLVSEVVGISVVRGGDTPGGGVISIPL
jgi:hypothetical protein